MTMEEPLIPAQSQQSPAEPVPQELRDTPEADTSKEEIVWDTKHVHHTSHGENVFD